VDRNDVIDLLTIVQVGDNRTVGETDIGFWFGMLGPFDKDDCLDAILAHRRDQPGVWLEPGHVSGRVRAARRDRLDRMSPDERARVVGGDAPRDRWGYIDKSNDRDDPRSDIGNFGRALTVQSERVDVLPKGTYIEADPAGWEYGMPRNVFEGDPDFDPDQRANLRTELDARIDRFLKKAESSGVEWSRAEAEHQIRLGDRDRADKFLRLVKRNDLADVLAGVVVGVDKPFKESAGSGDDGLF
jgi:hypothetical protein